MFDFGCRGAINRAPTSEIKYVSFRFRIVANVCINMYESIPINNNNILNSFHSINPGFK
jgi:hypothetical protein